MSASVSYRFGRFEVLPIGRKLLVDGRSVVVGGRALDLLQTLIEHRERMLTKDELLDRVWPDTIVEPNNLAVQIGALRKLLGPDAIATIPGRGYKFGLVLDDASGPAREALPPEQPAASPLAARHKTNLPETPTPLIGRTEEARALEALLDGHALVTITGAGGIGKSLLAQHLLHRRRDAYPHGVCWIDLSAVSESTALPAAVASALGVQLGAGEPAAALHAALAPLAMLVVLDNAEHLLEEVAGLAAALRDAAPTLRMVVTSQAPLNLSREHVYRLDALAVPPGPTTAAHALSYGAVALFVDRAQAADARFVFDDTNAATVIDLCRRLDGLPLAIELAAARAPVLGVRRIAESLEERLQSLTAGKRDAPARQQTLRAALDWSHGLLDAHERTVFRRLAVVAGSASLELIERIAADEPAAAAEAEPLDRWAVVDALSGLVDRSLVAVSPEGDDGERPRYRLLDSARAYAQERLSDAGEVERIAERHAHALAHLMEAAWDERWSGRLGVDAWRRSVEPDRDNARIAIEWAVTRTDLPLVCKLAPTMLLRGALGEGSHNERVALAEALERLLSTQPPAPAQLLTLVSLATVWIDKPQRSLPAARATVGLARAAGDRFALYVSLSIVARSALRLGEGELASASLAEMHAVEDPDWPPHRRYWSVETEAHCASIRGEDRSRASLSLWRKVLELLQAAGDNAHTVRSNLIDSELAAGDVPAAVASGLALVDLLEHTRDEFMLAVARANLLAALLAYDDLATARCVAEVGWGKAAGFGLQAFYADYLALLAALEARWVVAAHLAGYGTAAYARQNAPRWPNEARAFERTTGLIRSALGPVELEDLMAEGALLRDAQIAEIAFGADAVP